MFIIENYSTAIFFCVITMLCWGSWANTQKLAAGEWRFELFYWDYVIGILLTALLFAFTLGSMGEGGRGFLADAGQASGSKIGSAILGGVIFNAANILLAAAIAIAGMSVAFPVGIGLALVIGVIVNYIDLPVGNPVLIFGGVALVAIAILLNAFAFRRSASSKEGASDGEAASDKVAVSSGEAGSTRSAVSKKGLWLSVVSGILMGTFYKYVAASMFTDFSHPEPGKLSPYTAVVFFATGILLSNFLFNTILMKRPFAGAPVGYRDYFNGSFKNHLTGILGGLLWCIGMSFNIIASGKAGTAISYGLGQGATVVAAIWGIFVWKEFRGAPKGTGSILNLMLLCYLLGLGLLIAAR